jgi:hypothetical protein
MFQRWFFLKHMEKYGLLLTFYMKMVNNRVLIKEHYILSSRSYLTCSLYLMLVFVWVYLILHGRHHSILWSISANLQGGCTNYHKHTGLRINFTKLHIWHKYYHKTRFWGVPKFSSRPTCHSQIWTGSTWQPNRLYFDPTSNFQHGFFQEFSHWHVCTLKRLVLSI